MTQEDQFVPAEPGLKLAIWPGRRALTCPARRYSSEARLVLIVAWLMPGSEKYRSVKRKFNFQATDSPWPVTASGLHMPGSEPAAIVFPDGRAFEPGKNIWFDSVDDWITKETKRISASRKEIDEIDAKRRPVGPIIYTRDAKPFEGDPEFDCPEFDWKAMPQFPVEALADTKSWRIVDTSRDGETGWQRFEEVDLAQFSKRVQ